MCGMRRCDDISVLWGAVALALAASSPAAAKPKPVDSWGRANVDYATYRNDSLECGLLGYSADVSQTEQARMFAAASRQLESIDNSNYAGSGAMPSASVGSGGSQGGVQVPDVSTAAAMSRGVEQARQYEQVRRSIRPERRMEELKRGMTAIVEDCLRERGYTQFRLTDEQREALSRLRKGSDARREYLHSLASNRAVLETQVLPQDAS
jgi:hypothetical protein